MRAMKLSKLSFVFSVTILSICGLSVLMADPAKVELVVSHDCYGSRIEEDGRVVSGTAFGYPGRLCSDCCGGSRTFARWYNHEISGRQVSCVIISKIGRNDDISEAYAVYKDTGFSDSWISMPNNPYPDCHKSTLRP